MAKRTRITMTESDIKSPVGKQLLDFIFAMCHDGKLEISEVEDLHIFLRGASPCFAAIEFLRSITRAIVADGAIDEIEAYRLKLAFERVVPKSVRGIVSTHLEGIGLPIQDDEDNAPAWTKHAATDRQLEYIVNLGGVLTSGMTKGEAAKQIDELLERRPPTPRQQMLLRFFDRLDLLRSTKDEVGQWLDDLFADYPSKHEMAWDRFKRTTNHDPHGQDPTIVSVGEFRKHMRNP